MICTGDKDCLCSNLNYIIRRQVRVGVLFSIWIYLSCKYLFLVLWGLLRPNTTQASGQWWIEECIVIKLILIGQGCSTDSRAEPWSWAKILELIHLQTTNIWAKLHSYFFSTNEDLVIGDFLRTFLGGTLILFSLVGLLNSRRVTCLDLCLNQDVCYSLTDLSLPSRMSVTQGRLEHLNFIWPQLKMEALFKMASVWYLLTQDTAKPPSGWLCPHSITCKAYIYSLVTINKS